MALFNRDKRYNEDLTEETTHMLLSDYQLSESRKREIAIDYINSLSKKELDLFMEGARLIWEGYGILGKVKTPAEKKEEREAKEEEAFELESDDAVSNFLDLDDK